MPSTGQPSAHTAGYDELARIVGAMRPERLPVAATSDDLAAREVHALRSTMEALATKVEAIAGKPTTTLIIEEGAIRNELKALAIDDSEAMARQLTMLTLRSIAGNRDGAFTDFDSLLTNEGRRRG